jgi:radical SAM protein (TIGR01212 family)
MSSVSGGPSAGGWREAGLRYFSRNYFWRRKFGRKVWRVSLDAGLGCPNRDDTLDRRGCIFCNPASFSPSRRLGLSGITAQLGEGIRRLQVRHKVDRFVAYFQPGTNTYGPIRRLRALYEEALAHPQVVGLAIGTRPDCVPDEVLDLLEDLAGRTWLGVEYGLQTIHDRTLRWLDRGHRYEDFLDVLGRSRSRGLEIGAHVILGLPGESRPDMQATAVELARLGIDSVKLHNLYAVRGTRLADEVAGGHVRLPEMAEHVAAVADFLERLPPGCVVDRLSGDAAAEYLLAPRWCLHKSAVRAAVEAELDRRGTWQGSRSGGGR